MSKRYNSSLCPERRTKYGNKSSTTAALAASTKAMYTSAYRSTIKSAVMRAGAAGNASHRLTNDAASPANDIVAAARWLRLIAIPIITATEVRVSITSGREADMVELLIAAYAGGAV